MDFEGAEFLVLADGPDGADMVPARAELGASAASCVLGWLPGRREWVDTIARARALMGGYAVRDAIRDGRATYVPIRLSAIPRYLAALPRPIVAVVRGRPDGDGYCFGPSVGWAPAAAALADRVVVEIDVDAPRIPAPRIPGDIVA